MTRAMSGLSPLNGVPDVSAFPGDQYNLGEFSHLPGQRLSRCTCPGEAHPKPKHADRPFVGRSGPETGIFEATTAGHRGAVSQSGQLALFNAGYEWFNTTANFIVSEPTITELNAYTGGESFFCFPNFELEGGIGLNFLPCFPTSHLCDCPNQ